MTHLHGVKVETVYLPNSISTVLGLVSYRHRDISVPGGAGVDDISELNMYLKLHSMPCVQSILCSPWEQYKWFEFLMHQVLLQGILYTKQNDRVLLNL